MRISSINLGLLAFLAMGVVSCGSRPISSSPNSVSTGSELAYVRVPVAMLSPAWVQSTGFNRDHGQDEIYAVGWMSSESLANLSHEEKSAITQVNEQDVSQGRLNPFTLQSIVSLTDEGDFKEDYHNYVALTDELKSLANAHSDIAQLESIGKSNQGRDLWLMRISANIADGARKPKLLYIANMHGDEVVGRELSIYHIRRLLNDFGKDERITKLLNSSEVFIVSSMNPDGFEKGVRYNSKNIDLNRNFPDFTSDPVDTPAGRAVETAAIMALHAKHHFVAAINFHGGEVCFNLPWDTKPNTEGEKFGDDHILNPMGRAWADSNPTMYANDGGSFDHGVTYGYEWYEVDGGMQDWSIYYRQSMHATVELSYTKWPSASTLPKAWNENKEAMLVYLERAVRGIHVEAIDSEGNPVNGIEVSVASSKRPVSFKESFGTRTTTDGNQSITVKANGFQPATIQVAARVFNGSYDRVTMTRN